MRKKNGLVIVWAMAVFMFLGLGAILAKAGDVEFILGTSSGFKVVRGTSTASGTAILNTGTITATGGTTTVRISTNIYATGTITAAGGFVGDGSQLTNVSAGSPGANTVDSAQLVNTLDIMDTTINVGSFTASAGNFMVDNAGSMTATTLKVTGSATVSGTATVSGNLIVGGTSVYSVQTVTNPASGSAITITGTVVLISCSSSTTLGLKAGTDGQVAYIITKLNHPLSGCE